MTRRKVSKADEFTHVYIGKLKCGCVVSVCLDDAKHARDTNKFIVGQTRSGYALERISIEDYRTKIKIGCKCPKEAAPA